MKKLFLTAALVAATASGAVMAQSIPGEVKARQGQFRIMAINLGILGAMAKGQMEYDAEAAQAAADSLVGVAMVNQVPLWPAGTDNVAMAGITRALPAAWDNFDDVAAKWAAFGEAAAEAQAGVGGGQEAIGPLLGKLGGTCKACHDAYRGPAN